MQSLGAEFYRQRINLSLFSGLIRTYFRPERASTIAGISAMKNATETIKNVS